MANFSNYALFKMSVRGISTEDVELVLADPETRLVSESSGRPIYVRTVDGRPIHVVVEVDDENEVVTAFIP